MENIHERVLPASADEVGRLLDRAGSIDDPLWPTPTWSPMRFDRPLAVGADGGHDSVHYHVTAYDPGRRIEFTFHPRIGLVGTHTFEILPLGPDSSLIRHRMTGHTRGAMRLLWPVIVRTCHDAVLEHLLDNAEHAVTGSVARPFRYPLRARLAVAISVSQTRSRPVPPEAALLHTALPRPDLADAFSVRVPPGTSLDPQTWADAVFRDPPAVVTALLHLRNAVVAPFGIERGDRSAFDTLARSSNHPTPETSARSSGHSTADTLAGSGHPTPETPAGSSGHSTAQIAGGEVLLGTDAGHLDFRASILVEPDDDGTTVTLSTHATARSRAGRAYLALVRLVHPAVVRAMLRRAARKAVAPHPANRHHRAAASRSATSSVPAASSWPDATIA